ncbi:hypothetical protein ABPG74_011072 [Tetrahymena malaccensis]
MSKEVPQKLRDLIKAIRGCKTTAEERALVQKEKALIRESFNKNEEEYRPRNVAKLLFINMLGHNTDFGQMECLKLISAQSFTEKRIGYLGLTQLFHEQSDVLLMATSRLLTDLQSQNNYVASLAIIAVSEICTTDMCRELIGNILKIMQSGTSFTRKKAPLAAAKIMKKLPDHLPDIIEKINTLMEDRHHGVLIATLGLIEEIMLHDPTTKDKFKKYVTPMIKVLQGLVSHYDKDFEIAGVVDPFLQMKILKFFRYMGKGDPTVSEEVSNVLASVSSNTNSSKNTGNAVLYECVQTIMEIESSSHLKTLGINILGKFLSQKDYNSKYCALFMLKQVVNHDINAVQKHKQTILDCMKESDISVKQLALDLVYIITNEQNVKSIIKELLNYLLAVTDEGFLRELTNKICAIVDKHSPNRRWQVDTIIKVLTLAGNYIKEESTNNMIHLICMSPELQSYAVHKLYFSLNENINQNGLAKAAVYCIGEFGHLLVRGTPVAHQDTKVTVKEEEVMQLFEKLFERNKLPDNIKEYGLNALIKLYTKFTNSQNRIIDLVEMFQTSTSLEVQKRSCEYLKLIECQWDTNRNSILEPIPPYQPAIDQYSTKPVGDIDLDEYPPAPQNANTSDQTNALSQIGINDFGNNSKSNNAGNAAGGVDLLNLLGDDGDVSPIPAYNTNVVNSQVVQNPPAQQNDGLNLLNFYGNNQVGGVTPSVNTFNQTSSVSQSGYTPQNMGNLLDFGVSSPTTFGNVAQNVSQPAHSFTAFSDSNLDLIFNCDRNDTTTTITSIFNNKSGFPLTEIIFQVAVLKHLKLNMQPISNTMIAPYSQGQTTQVMTVQNSMQGQKGIALKIKIGYTLNGQQVSQQVQISNFPQGW